ncbi:MAG: hypothetical protein J5529_12615 [Prevotella sp.]|nr:hypothetical protein [Prevotella sp.]
MDGNIRRIFTFLLCALAIACGGDSDNKAGTLLPSSLHLQAGDVVMRMGNSVASHAVTALDRQGEYSHTGIVVDSCGVAMVVHAVPDEPDYDGDPDRVKMETPEEFFSTARAKSGEILRPTDSVAGAAAAKTAMEAYRRHTLFDHHYDDQDTTLMYCTELVVHAYRRAGVELMGKERHHINTPWMEVHCMFPSDLLRSPFLKSVCKIQSTSEKAPTP